MMSLTLLFPPATFQWSYIPTTGCIPGPRDGHTACLIGNIMYVFGGFEELENCFSNDIYALNLDTFVWSYVEAKGTPLSHRDFHSACAIGTRMYVFGGRGDLQGPYHSDSDIYCNRLAYFDTETSYWCYPRKRSDIPPGRRSHSAFVYNGEMYIFGGYESNKKLHYGNMYCFNPSKSAPDFSPVWNALCSLFRRRGNRPYLLNAVLPGINHFPRFTETEVWREFPIKVGRTGPPRARRRHSSIIAGDRLFIFGGTSPMNEYERLEYLKNSKAAQVSCPL